MSSSCLAFIHHRPRPVIRLSTVINFCAQCEAGRQINLFALTVSSISTTSDCCEMNKLRKAFAIHLWWTRCRAINFPLKICSSPLWNSNKSEHKLLTGSNKKPFGESGKGSTEYCSLWRDSQMCENQSCFSGHTECGQLSCWVEFSFWHFSFLAFVAARAEKIPTLELDIHEVFVSEQAAIYVLAFSLCRGIFLHCIDSFTYRAECVCVWLKARPLKAPRNEKNVNFQTHTKINSKNFSRIFFLHFTFPIKNGFLAPCYVLHKGKALKQFSFWSKRQKNKKEETKQHTAMAKKLFSFSALEKSFLLMYFYYVYIEYALC